MIAFLFHRDLRLDDNTALISALQKGQPIAPVFIFTPTQIDPQKNAHFSHPAVEFMCECLEDLNSGDSLGGTLNTYIGENIPVLASIHAKTPLSAICTNLDYSPYARARDIEIKSWCLTNGIGFMGVEDYDLISMDEGLGPNGPYLVFTPYMRNLLKNYEVCQPVSAPKDIQSRFIHLGASVNIKDLFTPLPGLAVHGGREPALARLAATAKSTDYMRLRDFPATPTGGATMLSAYLKFGCISIREAWAALIKAPAIQRELIFRSFYAHLTYHRPEILTETLKPVADTWFGPIWAKNKPFYERFITGYTGVPMVDAGIRQLLATGWCHNRLRMIIASFGCKNLLLDWRPLSRWFGTKLVDVDISSNVHGWLWSNSLGADGVPYFRYPFNPYTQSKKFDPKAEFIKKWVPELAPVPAKAIHDWGNPNIRSLYPSINYAPIVDARTSGADAVILYKQAWTGAPMTKKQKFQ